MASSRVVSVALVLSVLTWSRAPAFADEKPTLATGEYRILLGGKRIGDEQFRIGKGKGFVIKATKTLYWPEPSREELSFQLDAGFRPDRVLLEATRASLLTSLEIRAQGKNWRSETKGRGLKSVKQELGRRDGSEIHLGSPLFHWVILKRFALGPEDSGTIDAVTLALPALGGKREPLAYRRLPDEETESEALGKVSTAVYEVTFPDSTERLWVAPSGFPLRSRRESPAGTIETVLVRLQMKPGTL